MGFDGEGVFQQPLLGGDLLTLLPEVFKVEFDGLSCHRLFDGLPEGDASTGEDRYGDSISAFRLFPKEYTVVQREY